MRLPSTIAILAAAALGLVPGSALAANASVGVGNDRTLSPTSVTINPGDTVTWTWVGPDTDHSIVSSPAGQVETFDSDPVAQDSTRNVGGTFQKTFQRSGAFTYVCRIHPSDMRGTVNVTGMPVASLTATPVNPFTDESVAFSAAASTDDGTITKYEWDLDGNGTFELDTGAVATTSRSYPAVVPSFNARVRVTDNGLNVATSAPRAIAVRSRNPVASFTATPATVAKHASIALDASASSDPDGGTIAQYAWDLDGNGTYEHDTGTTATTTTSFATMGARTIGLRVTDSDLRTGTTTRAVSVTNQAPVASAAVNDAAPLTGVSVTFDASASTDPDGSVASYRWDFDGDLVFDTAASTVATVAHAFARPGARSVRVRVTDDDGTTHDALVAVTVGNRAPSAAFTFAPVAAVAGSPVAFDGSGSADPEATALAYAWDFDGNGSYETSSGASPTTSRTFASAGTVTVGLRVTDADGGTHTASQVVTVAPAPPPPPAPPAPAEPAAPAAPAAQAASSAAATPLPLTVAPPALVPASAGSRSVLTAAASRGQAKLGKGTVALKVRCSAACTITATGTLKARGAKKALRLATLTRALRAGTSVTLTLRLSARDRRSLRGRRSGTATITISAPGAAPQRVTVALKR